jgi:hypothetical protein
MGSPKHVVLRQCEVQVGEMRGAAASGYPKQTTPLWGRRWRATQQTAYLHEQCLALHV